MQNLYTKGIWMTSCNFPPISSSPMKKKKKETMPVSIVVFFIISALLHPLSASDLLAGPTTKSPSHQTLTAAHSSSLRLPPGERVEGSPGSRPGSTVVCNRVHVRGLSRLRDLSKFAHSLKIRVLIAHGDAGAAFRSHAVEICLHRNASVGVGMCPPTEWHKLSKGSWIRSVSPFGDWILDIRTLPDPSRSIDVSTEQEFLYHRVALLVLGLLMMAAARVLSESVIFYYGSAMVVGIVLVILIVLFQGMRLLPTGRKSSLAIVLYSSIVGLGALLLRHVSGLLRSALLEIGIGEDMINPLGILLLVCLGLAGAWFGYWGVRKLALTDDGLVDAGVAYFVEWAILIFAAAMIIQSSLDITLAAGALGCAIVITAISRTHGKLRILRRFFKRIYKYIRGVLIQIFGVSELRTGSSMPQSRRFGPSYYDSAIQDKVTRLTSSQDSYEGDSYLSTFHKTPERKRFSKEEWEKFTREHTKKALRELVSSPDFNKWAVANAERISLTPPRDDRGSNRRHFFRWF